MTLEEFKKFVAFREVTYSCFSYNAIVAFLKNTALWKNRVIQTIGSIGMKGLGVESLDSPSRM
jgi:hypothetical protein